MHNAAIPTTDTKNPLYWVWTAMWSRCTDPRATSYRDYGGRGITVCDRWRSFEAFVSDVGPRPVHRTLDRINNDGNYEPGNVRWATHKEQAVNRRPMRRMRRAVAGGSLRDARKALRRGVEETGSMRQVALRLGVQTSTVLRWIRGDMGMRGPTRVLIRNLWGAPKAEVPNA